MKRMFENGKFKPFNTFFSVRKDEKFTFYSVFGVKFKLRRSSFRKVLNQRQNLKKQYENVLKTLKDRKEKKYRVGFLVSEIQKWKCQSVFDLMKLDQCFEPVIVIVPIRRENETLSVVENRMLEYVDFFRAKNMDCVVAWDFSHREVLLLDEFNLDIVFYQQPWAIDKKHSVEEVSKKSLTYYVPYYVPAYGYIGLDCMPFHYQMYRYYVLNEAWKDLFLTEMNGYEEELCPVGHPMLDYFIDNPNVKEKQYVIFAPHHSLTENSIGLGTFHWSGLEVLKYAEQHPEFNWVYKPHPVLKESLLKSQLMTSEQVENYWRAWEAIGEVYEGGEYMPIFNDSSCLITDCGSFLVEYFYTGNPVIHLKSGKAKEPVFALKEILDCYYAASSKDSLLESMESLLVEKKDILANKRLKKLDNLFDGLESSSQKIVKDIKKTLYLLQSSHKEIF